jgi:hypothetical protein
MVDFLEEHFVLATVDARHERTREDWVGDIVRQTRCVTFTAAGRKSVISASGKSLGQVRSVKSLDKVWDAWQALPESERVPGAVKVGDNRPVDRAYEPPPSALVLRTYTRQVERDKDGTLRYTEPEDYPEPEPDGTRSGSPRRQADRFREAGHDFMWVPESEWRALIPKDPQVGDRGPVRDAFKLRVLRYHLDPERGLGEAQWFTGASLDDGELEWVVESVSGDEVRLRLDGHAKLRRDGGRLGPTEYKPTLLGYLTYDLRNKSVTEFKMIALGDVLNTPRGVRPGWHPLGITFELVANPTPAERIVPRGGRDNAERYLNIEVR